MFLPYISGTTSVAPPSSVIFALLFSHMKSGILVKMLSANFLRTAESVVDKSASTLLGSLATTCSSSA